MSFTDKRGVFQEIVEAIEAGGNAHCEEYDLDYIADTAYEFDGRVFECIVDVEEFWDLTVKAQERMTEVRFLDEAHVNEDGTESRVMEIDVINGDGEEDTIRVRFTPQESTEWESEIYENALYAAGFDVVNVDDRAHTIWVSRKLG